MALAALEAVPGVYGHDQSALLSQLVVSNGRAIASKVDPFTQDNSTHPCAGLQSTFGMGNHLFKNREFGFYASIWPSYQALSALYVTSLSRDRSACSSAFERTIEAIDANYWDDSVPGSPDAFDQGPTAFHVSSDLPRVDDSLWMGLAIMQDYAMTQAPALLDRANAVFHLALRNWTTSGGIYWEATGANNRSKAVVSNGPAALLGVELFLQTGDRNDLVWSERIVDWLRSDLLDPATGLFDDNSVERDHRETRDTTKFTYTQGTMVGALMVLSLVDPSHYPMSESLRLAERSMAYFDLHHSYGQPGFDLIWAENILWAAGVSRDAAFTAQARGAVQQALAAEPEGQGDLLTTSSETALRELTELPSSSYRSLLYVTEPLSRRPHRPPTSTSDR